MKLKQAAFVFLVVLAGVLFAILFPYFRGSDVLSPSGAVAHAERDLIVLATNLMLIIVIPVLLLTFFVCYRYRASNKKSKYTPYWDYNLWAESLWWGFPFVIVIGLSVVAWHSSFALDPFKEIKSTEKPLRIQVVALQWRWLFIYPEEKIATLNFVRFPEKRPIHFEITADAPMNSFWIPSLAGQIYAMPGMRTQLYLIADKEGVFRGSSANLSGDGFASMTFNAIASPKESYEEWLASAQSSGQNLDADSYQQLVKPSIPKGEETFLLKDDDLYNQVIMKYMTPSKEHSH